MLNFYRLAVLFLLGIGLAARPAAGQSAAKWTPEAYRELNQLPGGYNLGHYFLERTGFPEAVFRHTVLDSALRPLHQYDLKLTGYDITLASHALNQRAALYRFRRRGTDSVLATVIDTAGRVLSVHREAHHTPPARFQNPPLLLRSDSLFLVTKVSRKSRSLLVRCFDLQQRERWHLTLVPTRGRTHLLAVTSDQQYVWLVNASNSLSRRTEHTAYCVALASGQVVSTTLLDYQGERRIACRSLLGADHALTVVGRAYHHQRISRVHSGDLFVTRLAPNGTHLLDRSSPLGNQPGLLGDHRAKTYWQSLVADSSGNLRLVGQSFTSTSWGGNFAIMMASSLVTLGIFRVSFTTLHPRDLVSLQFDPQGQLTQARAMPLPEGNSYMQPGYVPAQLMAELAAQAGIFPVRALTPDGRQAILRTQHQLFLLDFDTQRQQLLRDANALGTADVWGLRGGRVLLYRPSRLSPHQLDLEPVSYAK